MWKEAAATHIINIDAKLNDQQLPTVLLLA